MLFTFNAGHQQHAPGEILIRGNPLPNWEQPERLERLKAQLIAEHHELQESRTYSRKWIAAVHDVGYLNFLETAHERWTEFMAKQGGANSDRSSASLIQAHVFAHHSSREKPSSIQGQVGYYLSGGSCPVDAGTWKAALGSVDTALSAADLVLEGGAKHAYALCRPPGHHAYADFAGGFCYLNNAAVAANYLANKLGRVAILDVDAHHGNGTQSIFYERDDVHFVSIHGDPNVLFPFYAGYAHERGQGAGLGHNLNIPLPLGTEDEAFLAAVRQGMQSVVNYGPDALVVSLGFDAYKGDPAAGLEVSTEGFEQLGRMIGGFTGPVLLIQEGGYVVQKLAENMQAFLKGFLGQRV
jgi:Deacetylases, including yeast histone deacetylase and acetoin utilization protein